MPKKPPPTRTLTPEDKEHWQEAINLIQPLKSKQRHIKEPEKQELKRQETLVRADRPIMKAPLHDLGLGVYEGIDKNTRERFRKGSYPIDARLDLHGYAREEAQKNVEDFIHHHYLAQHRCLLIVTGKGQAGLGGSAPRHGVLKELLPSWLAEDSLRPYILAFDRAASKHGGSGATYVLLRRRREYD